MTDLNNVVNAAFALEPSKLQRIVGIIESAFDPVGFNLSFQAVLENKNKLSLSTLTELLAHDNTVANPIRHLVIRASSDDKKCRIQFSDETFPSTVSVSLDVESVDSRWANHLMAELEEQVDRLAMPGPIYKVKQSAQLRNSLPLIFLVVISILFMVWFANHPPDQTLEVRKQELVQAAQHAKEADAKLSAIVNLSIFIAEGGVNAKQASRPTLPSLGPPDILLAFPILLCIGLAYYCITHCYPAAVFAWGDCGERYATIVSRRRTIWATLFGTLLLAILVNLSSGVLARLIGV